MSPDPPKVIQQWEVVTMDFPFIDKTQKKTRPVLVISNTDFNRVSNSLVVVQISTNLNSGFREYNVELTEEDINLYPGGYLKKKSIIKPYIVFSVAKGMVRARVGLLSSEKVEDVKRVIRKLYRL
ncbi:type II toxin-antitoxin system PemK/MazF family toxin [Thermococcus sp. SY098]|uniref:type II toxin-antitoxin system PemK/MazF family toxin n=1 Tax=Thermococcus sp. SY098 TaxID=3111325 RepID=UPI002D791E38|nr:type II toxin-antitoxin system PemK/MazF family toxin [Thermococcus sp. SY098]WRS53311.1 type II toxin-antitoxin system PemK/MazF family toxin [Thermococcus sp. SY098]